MRLLKLLFILYSVYAICFISQINFKGVIRINQEIKTSTAQRKLIKRQAEYIKHLEKIIEHKLYERI